MPTVFYWVCRLCVSAILIASALGKSLDLPGFMNVLTTYRAFPDWALWPIGLLVTAVEWVLGIWLLSGGGSTLARSPRRSSTPAMPSG